jgi:hypothetical protein
MPAWGYEFLIGGVVIGLLVGCGLMALAFYSSCRGYDEPTVVQKKDSDDSEDRH